MDPRAWPDTLGALVRSLRDRDAAVVVDDLSHDPVEAGGLVAHVAAICAALRAAGVDGGEPIAVRVGHDAPSVAALLAAASYGVAAPVAADAPDLPSGPFGIRAVVTTVPPVGDEAPVTVDASDPSALPPGDAGEVPVRAPEDPALLLCTSGTTGEPKWVRLSQRNLIAAGTFISESLKLSPGDRGLSTMPLHHGHGITAGVLAPLLSGGELVIIDSSDLDFLQEGLRCGITWYSAAPTVHASLLVAKRSWPSWFAAFRPRVIRSTSEALPARDRARLEAEFGAPVIEAYALTEVPGHACTQVLGTATDPGWMPPQDGLQVETVGADGRPTAPGVPGRVRVRGPNVMLGYLGHDPIGPDGWYLTSDIGAFRPDGALSVLGRDSEAIKRGGETIAPAVVESLVEKHPDVERARVCGMPHESLGEQICVAVISHRGEPDAGDLLRELRALLPTSMAPSKLRVVEAFPDNGGKVRRSDLRPLFAE
ncbi:AMP-binding protein [Actinomadura opuntiae]|uniref:AMP-binding protein n=1 Tax=Actinomadura sp. OS1-43 TaxID=604315 RepID=UPI00255A7206|nr:AMP-binding protein [Actinomadura sp. OS1-43]MDL4818697.1 AMP-binding protein [Actinomadura sp. OS1-43]